MRYVRLRIQGRVQGVGFRHFVLRHAVALGLGGTVRNLPDGSVEVEAEGDVERLGRLLDLAGRGPSGAVVTDVSAQWGEGSSRFRDFHVKP